MTHAAIDSHRYIPRNLLCASISGVLLVAAVSVQAQETNAASNLERITVTGSNIPARIPRPRRQSRLSLVRTSRVPVVPQLQSIYRL